MRELSRVFSITTASSRTVTISALPAVAGSSTIRITGCGLNENCGESLVNVRQTTPAVWGNGPLDLLHGVGIRLAYLYRTAVASDFPVPLVGLQVTDYGPDARVVTVIGELDALTAPTLAACLSAQLAVAEVVVVNLDDLKFLASAGLRVLFEMNELAIERDRCLRFVCNCPLANLALEATGLRQHLTFADDVADALCAEP